MSREEVVRIAAEVGERRGWDFSRVRVSRDSVPWEYEDVVRRFLGPDCHVLDLGTGGGERFIALADAFGSGVGIDNDPLMIRTARENTPADLASKMSFGVMRASSLEFAPETFDVVLDRHAPIFPHETARVLKPGGHFITQQVGGRDGNNVHGAFGWSSTGRYWASFWRQSGQPQQDVTSLADAFRKLGFAIVARGEYDVACYFEDLESLVFHLKSVPTPEQFNPEKHWQNVDRLVAAHSTERGIESNEHRELLIVRKPVRS